MTDLLSLELRLVFEARISLTQTECHSLAMRYIMHVIKTKLIRKKPNLLASLLSRLLLAAFVCLAILNPANAQSAQYKDAFSAYQIQNFTVAENIWTELADNGNINAQYALGVMHLRQEATDSSPAAAFSWFRKAASLGHATAMFNLGVAYWEGSGVAQDKSQALTLWEQSAEQGDSGAQFNLGLAYYIGEERALNLPEAARWISLAAEQNHPEAKRILKIISAEINRSPTLEKAAVNKASEPPVGTTSDVPVQPSDRENTVVTSIASPATDNKVQSPEQESAAEEFEYWKTVDKAIPIFDVPNGVVFRQLPPGTPLELVSQKGDWARITLPAGLRTWIYSKYIDVNGNRGVINADGVRVRPSPSTSNSTSPPLGKYRRGEKVVVLDSKGDWTEIRAPKDIGAWLRTEYMVKYLDTEMNRQQQWTKSSAHGA